MADYNINENGIMIGKDSVRIVRRNSGVQSALDGAAHGTAGKIKKS